MNKMVLWELGNRWWDMTAVFFEGIWLGGEGKGGASFVR